jgi:hypothetical protein
VLLRDLEAIIVEYVKVEDDEFLKLPECGVYFHAGSDGVIVACRVYYQASGEYFPADAETKTACADVETIEESIAKYGTPLRNVPSNRIPGKAPTSPGCEFLVRGKNKDFFAFLLCPVFAELAAVPFLLISIMATVFENSSLIGEVKRIEIFSIYYNSLDEVIDFLFLHWSSPYPWSC